MSRKLRRIQEKHQRIDLMQMQKRYQKQAQVIAQEVANETEEFAKHHITGQLLTAMAIVLRKVYGWSVDDTGDMLDQVNGITNALNAGEIDDADLVTEGEQWGVKVQWRLMNSRTYISGIDVYEENQND
jgi:hypothetical protein